MKNQYPDWIGIGCVKCGTSWTWQQLKKHPQIYSPTKELNYFTYEHLHSDSTYRSYFEGKEDHQIAGEWTPDYFTNPKSLQLIKEKIPWVKLLVAFRNPIDRAWSNYKHALFEGRLNDIKFEECWNIWKIRRRSMYSKTLERWLDAFGDKQLKVLWYDDIISQPKKYMKSVFEHLEIDSTFVLPNISERFLFSYHNSEMDSLVLSPETRQKWVEGYIEDIENLEKITGRDLSHWKK